MNVLHLVSGKLSGGAARGALWLHQSLLRSGINSRVLTNSGSVSSYEAVESIALTKKGALFSLVRKELDKLPTYLYRSRSKNIFSPAFSGFDFTKTAHYQWADIIHLHWINAGFINLKTISKIKKPLLWTMRDMWPMTGGCHYAMECEQYKEGCGRCSQLNNRGKMDLSRLIVSRKIRLIPKNVRLVGVSEWLTNCAQESLLFRGYNLSTICNGINLQEFFPVNKGVARSILGVSNNQRLILVAAQDLGDFHKGFHKYIDAIKLVEKGDLLFVFFGNLDINRIMQLKINFLNLGFLHDAVSLRLAYSAADVFVAPSLMDAFGKTLAESLACATPVVCFDATGPKDIVDHKINGYKAVPYSHEDLAAGISWVLADKSRHESLCEKAREKACRSFDIDEIAKRYCRLYQSMQ